MISSKEYHNMFWDKKTIFSCTEGMISSKEYHNMFWDKKTIFSCTDCGYAMALSDHASVIRKLSEVHETDMDFFTCPQCGKEAIVLW